MDFVMYTYLNHIYTLEAWSLRLHQVINLFYGIVTAGIVTSQS